MLTEEGVCICDPAKGYVINFLDKCACPIPMVEGPDGVCFGEFRGKSRSIFYSLSSLPVFFDIVQNHFNISYQISAYMLHNLRFYLIPYLAKDDFGYKFSESDDIWICPHGVALPQ